MPKIEPGGVAPAKAEPDVRPKTESAGVARGSNAAVKVDPDDHDEDDRARHGRHRRPPRKQPLWKELLVLAGVALVLTFFIQHFIGRVYSIPSGSMEQTLHGCAGCTGDRVFVDKIVYDFRDPSPGDVVVFQGPNTWTENDVKAAKAGNAFTRGLQYVGSLIGIAPPDERDFVKRVIAVGGQTVECCDEKMRVKVDDEPLDEPYVYWEHGGPDERQRFDRVTVPEGTLWVMGDNRGNSSDSRFQGGGGIRGVVPLGKVIGKARYIVLPPSRWRGVGDHNPQGAADIAAPGWHQGIPAGIGIAAAWPVLWIGRRAKNALTPRKAD
nr:signal peptidase I [Alloactinosynnema sp. L-07]